MKPNVSTCLAALTAAITVHAAPTDQAIVAAMKIVDAPNYTWTCSVPSIGRALPVREGKTEKKSGFSVVTFIDPQTPMLRQISRLNDGVVLGVFRGEGNFVFQTSDGWKTGKELPPPGPRRRGAGGSDYWISIQIPHEELEIIIGSYTEMHVVDGGVTGTLSEDGARQLLGATKAPAVTAAGTFVFEIAGGVLTKYAVDISGTVLIGPPGEEKESAPQRRALLTEFKNVGHTVVDVPAEARQKLER